MNLVVEYIVVIPENGSFCDSLEGFNKLLEVDSNLKIDRGTIVYMKSFKCKYKATSELIQEKNQRFFHLRFEMEEKSISQSKINRFTDFLRVIRTIISKTGSRPETLWDDISLYYSKKSYPLIHEVENLMRKLISNFMLVTVGQEWVTDSLPKETHEVIEKGKRKEYLNLLHQVDFIHLADILLKPYSAHTNNDIVDMIRKARTISDLKEIQENLPKSNWNRYFSSLVACDDGFLQKKWKKLYDYRCKIAHNALLTKSDYEDICNLSESLKEVLVDAVNKLPQVSVPTSERDLVAETAANATDSMYGSFLTNWKNLVYLIKHNVIPQLRLEKSHITFQIIDAANELYSRRLISNTDRKLISRLLVVRTKIISEVSLEYTTNELREYIVALKELYEKISALCDANAAFAETEDITDDLSTNELSENGY